MLQYVNMESPTQILYKLAGYPKVEDVEDVNCRCWLCGSTTDRGVPWEKWQGDNFTDQNKCRVPESGFVCPACVWACAWSPPPGEPKPEKGKKGKNLRMYSHFYDDRGYLYLNKADKPKILEWLRGPRKGWWFACISDSGQKHMLPWTILNVAGMNDGIGVVYFEQRNVILGDWAVVDSMIGMLTNGVTKTEIMSGEYRPSSWIFLKKEITEFEDKFRKLRGGSWFDLALWLSQRNEEKWKEINDRRKQEKREKQIAKKRGRSGKNKRSSDKSSSRSKVRGNKSRGSSDKTHRTDSGQDESVSSSKRDSRRVVHDAVKKTKPGRPEQLDLFDLG